MLILHHRHHFPKGLWHTKMDQQAGKETTTGIGGGGGSSPPHAGRSGLEEDEPAAGNSVRGVAGASRLPRGRSWDDHRRRSRSNRLHKIRYGGARDEADAGDCSCYAGREDDGSPVGPAVDGGDRAEGSTSVYFHAQQYEEEDDDPDARDSSLPTKMGRGRSEEGRGAGLMVGSRTVPLSSYGSGGRPGNFVGGDIEASRPRGRWDDEYCRSRNSRRSRGYRHDDLRDPPADHERDRFQAEHEDGSTDDSSPTKMGRRSQQVGEEPTRIIRGTPPRRPSCRSAGDQPHEFADATVRRGASRPASRYWAAADHRRRRNVLLSYREGDGGVDDLLWDEGVRSHLPAEHDHDQDGSNMHPLHTNMERQADQGEAATGISMIGSPPVPSSRWGGQAAGSFVGGGGRVPDDFAGEAQLIGGGAASRPRGRWPPGGDYPSSSWLNNEGYYGSSRCVDVRDLPADTDEGTTTVRFRQLGRRGGHDDHQDRRRRSDVVAIQEDGSRPADHEAGSTVRSGFDPAEHEVDGSDGDAARSVDGRFQDGRRDHEDRSNMVQPADDDGGLLVYDNIVVGNPSGVIFGRRNYAGGRVTGRVSGNRVIR